MNILDGSESFLPKFKLDCSFELSESSVKVTSEGLNIAKVDSMSLMRVFLSVKKILSKLFTKTTEFRLARVDSTELEGLEGDVLLKGKDRKSAQLTFVSTCGNNIRGGGGGCFSLFPQHPPGKSLPISSYS